MWVSGSRCMIDCDISSLCLKHSKASVPNRSNVSNCAWVPYLIQQVLPSVWVDVTASWAAACPPSFRASINNLPDPVISMAPTPFSVPLAHLLVLSTKTVDDKGVKELINKWQKRGEREESAIILSDRCYQSLEQQQEQRDCSEGDFHCFKTLVHKGKETSEETSSQFWMGIQTLFGSFSCLWRSFLRLFL